MPRCRRSTNLGPVSLQGVTQPGSVKPGGTGVGQHDQIDSGELLAVAPEGFPDRPLDAMAVHRTAHMLFRDRQAKAGLLPVIGPMQHGETAVPVPRCLGEHSPVVGRRGQPATPIEVLMSQGVRPESGRQAGAAARTARVDDLATAFGGHTGAETVGTRALQAAGLEGAFHDMSRR